MGTYSTLGLTLLWIIHILLIRHVHTSGVFELRLVSFTNSLGLNSDGNCCNGIHTTSGTCSSTCRTFFRICLKHYQNDIEKDTPCTFGTISTPVIGNNSFNFPDILQSFTNPVKLPFTFAWPGTFSLIIEAWHDTTLKGPTQGSPRDLISRLATQRSVSVDAHWTQDTHKSQNAELKYEYRVVCDDGYYGDDCKLACTPRDDNNGHFTCKEDGSIECLEGWTGKYCVTAVCLDGCHPEHGECNRPNECSCKLGWQGRLCNECIRYPGCQHGTCEKPWQCECKEGWGGLFCNQDLNFCTHHSPCRNAGTCHNTGQGSYTCECPPGFTGTNCEMEVDSCQHLQPCLNGGSCVNEGPHYVCRCRVGYHGRHCESSASSCEEAPCENGGVCAALQAGGYRCTCTPGYTGVNCEVQADECSSSPCLNGGRCIDETNGFRCLCPTGFRGNRCQENLNECSPNPCQHGGTCLDRINDFVCRCVPGFVGSLCEQNVDDCLNYPCANGGRCHDLVNDFRCDCAPGFSGKDCRDNVDECADRPCQNGATCHDQINDYECTCRAGFYGKNCEFSADNPVPTVPLTKPGSNNGGGNDPPTTTVGEPAVAPVRPGPETIVKDNSMLTMEQLLLIICLGVGIPIIIIMIIIVFLLCQRRRQAAAAQDSRAHKDNEQNEITSMNNQAKKCIDTNIINTIPPSSSVLKITNEELDSRTYNINQTRNHLNIDRNSKNYTKDINTVVRGTQSVKEHFDTRDNKRLSCSYISHPQSSTPLTVEHLQECAADTSIVDNTSCVPGSHLRPASTLYPPIVDVHKPINKETNSNSIFYLEKPHRHRPPGYSGDMLATEV